MSEIIHGRNMIIDVYKVDDYYPFVCADDGTIEIETEKKSVKTVGDGKWKKYRVQALGWKISASSLIPYDEPTNVTIFDIVDRQLNSLAVPIRAVFYDNADNALKSFNGDVIIDTSSLGGPAGSGATGSFNATGSGPLVIYDGLTACDSDIDTLTLDSQTSTAATFAYTGVSLAARFNYTIEAAISGIVFASGVVFTPAMPSGTFTISPILPNGSQIIRVTTICENGETGETISLTYTKT